MAGDDGLGDAFYEGHAETDFTGYSVSYMKKMLDEVNSAEGGRVSHAWLTVRNSLAGEDGEGRAAGSIAGDLRKAVRDVEDHWHGPAADAFSRAAEQLAKDFVRAAAQAKDASDAVKTAFQELRTAKDVLDDLEEPGVLARAGDYLSDWGSRNDSGLIEDVNDPARTASLEETTEKNEGDLSAGKEYQMRGAAALTRLAGAYRYQAHRMDGIRSDRVGFNPENPEGPGAEGGAGAGGAVPAPVIVAPVPRGDSPARTSRTPTGGAVPPSASRAPQDPAATGPAPSGTDIDAAHPGTAAKQPPGETPAASRPSGPQPGAPTGPGGAGVVPPGSGTAPHTPGLGGGPGSSGRATPGTPAPQQGSSTAARGGTPGTPGTPVPGAAGAGSAAGGAAGEQTKQPRGRPRFVRPSDEESLEKPKPVSRAGQLNTPGGTGLGTRGRGMRTDAKQKQEEEDAQRDPSESSDSAVDDQGTWTPRRRSPQVSDETGTE